MTDNAGTQHPGLELLHAEMTRQCADALATLDSAQDAAAEIVASLRRTGRLVLYAMGGSQHVNRIVEPLYREAGIEARSMIASEALMAPLPGKDARTAVIVSQSGESGEIIGLLERPAGAEERFGLTLEGGSTLARGVRRAIVAAGGTERAFAATRSIVLTLAMHAAVLEALGIPQAELRKLLAANEPADVTAMDAALADCDVFVFAGRHVMQGAAESAALSLMELARVPAIGFEGGQFRHGPFEFLRPGLGIVLLRSAGPDKDEVRQLAEGPVDAGCKVVVLDASGEESFPGALHVRLAAGSGLAAAASALLTLQRFNILVAQRRIEAGIGTPLRTSKVTV
ncbi:Fructoselysine-6-P-deglycase FrlB with duplicated sugar isomerase (SIS) domain [Faunimonas pinastri]|uniref:Glutamine--fructose-6-phosphate aminotransferase [isomerizing] n=1 Tax=Faunimonas pinastri TaxID=1855383 RepID=A0A1H9DYH7_9HYPH|nr:hypothetical protein [Faunimonas pinastri]SEQ18505.1 Fructoselysine-6-P-deglycase FrlB with duplicated sugar isomerase (SIS) domain [Faunimonas pinastri]